MKYIEDVKITWHVGVRISPCGHLVIGHKADQTIRCAERRKTKLLGTCRLTVLNLHAT
jgi:hypothetical protein